MEKKKILKIDFYFLIVYLSLAISKLILDISINHIEKSVKPVCLWPVAGSKCSFYTNEHSVLKLISLGIIPLVVFIYGVWYIIKIIKNKNILLSNKIIRIVVILLLWIIICRRWFL